ncbi:MAG: ATP-binding cassette domain-containing protein [Actinomycetota bacterium]|nr:ATP-binding cassette domain-containing protein [Actinomycetota bacterium]
MKNRSHSLSGVHLKNAIEATDLRKSYGTVNALDGIDLSVEEGKILGVLGPNGAGKTTLVKILTTLTRPDSGRCIVAGYDVVAQARQVREKIGLTGQATAVQEELTGAENLEIMARLYHMPKRTAKSRALELLDRFDLLDAKDRAAKTYSGGMKRRLDLAASLVGSPSVLFLDEPTTGLDPRARIGMWKVIENLVGGGTTLLLTTQYLDEADELADEIIVFDKGKIIAKGTSDELKRSVGGDVLNVQVAEEEDLAEVSRVLETLASTSANVSNEELIVRIGVGSRGSSALAEALRELDRLEISVADISIRRPSLDDVFLQLTGHSTAEGPGTSSSKRTKLKRGEANES